MAPVVTPVNENIANREEQPVNNDSPQVAENEQLGEQREQNQPE